MPVISRIIALLRHSALYINFLCSRYIHQQCKCDPVLRLPAVPVDRSYVCFAGMMGVAERERRDAMVCVNPAFDSEGVVSAPEQCRRPSERVTLGGRTLSKRSVRRPRDAADVDRYAMVNTSSRQYSTLANSFQFPEVCGTPLWSLSWANSKFFMVGVKIGT